MRTGTGKSAALSSDVRRRARPARRQHFKDAWFVGYTRQLVAGVWVGNDANRPMKKVSGGTLPATIWKTFMETATAEDPVVALPGTNIVDEAPQVATNEGTSAFDQLLSSLFESEPDAEAEARAYDDELAFRSFQYCDRPRLREKSPAHARDSQRFPATTENRKSQTASYQSRQHEPHRWQKCIAPIEHVIQR